MPPGQPPVDLLRQRLSTPRFDRYVAAVPGAAPEDGLALYRWNLDVSAALYRDLAVFEVVLRNDLVVQLETKYGAAWWQADHKEAAPLSDRAWLDIEAAVQRATARRRDAVAHHGGKVVAELTLGFWRFLLTKTYRGTLWPNGLERAFVHGPFQDREQIDRAVLRIYLLRNRIAHHEPLFTRDLPADLRTIVEVTGWVCPQTATWVASESTVGAVLRRQPPLRPRSRSRGRRRR